MAGEYRKKLPPAPADFQYIDDMEVSHHCSAHTFNPDSGHFDGPRCRSWVKPGAKVCKRHGGSVPRVRTAAELRENEIQVRARLRKKLSNGGLTPIEDVYAALEDNAAEAQMFKEIVWQRLNDITGEEGWRYKSTAGEQLRAEVALYERAMERANKFLVDYVKLGIADRRVKVAEAQALILVGVIQNILNRLDLTRDQKRIAATVVPDELRAISSQPE